MTPIRKKMRKWSSLKKKKKEIQVKENFEKKKVEKRRLNINSSRFGKENDIKQEMTVYEKTRCDYVVGYDDEGNPIRCKRWAIGKGTLCKKHGGIRVPARELIQDVETHLSVVGCHASFRPDYHPIKYIEFSKEGMSPVEIAAEFEVSLGTLKDWSEKYSNFAVAWEVGEAMHEAWWLGVGKEGLRDTKFNGSLYKFLTGNKLGYSDKIESKSTNTHIHGVLLVPDAMTPEEWERQNAIDVEVN
jgi:hypothetical protein